MRQLLVVRLVQDAVPYSSVVGPLAAVAGDPREQRQVVVAPGDLDRVELERAEPVDDAHDRGGLGGQRTRRREEVAGDEEPARDLARDVADGGVVTRPMLRGVPAVACQVASRTGPPSRRSRLGYAQKDQNTGTRNTATRR